ncbi:glycosyltransferase [Flavobacterium myungsuense]|uniref:Glycosyltransferase n=2 Tax=Flavobacterium myungsuense TaxID=651823 RepID=A0ABW3J694_9FLAO
MNILLVGEYSRLHNSLKEGLIKLGHNVVIIGFNDGFKNYPVDYPIVLKWNSSFPKKIKVGIYKLTGFNITSYFTYKQFKKYQLNLVGFDVVQLINENSFYCGLYYEKRILKFLFENNKKSFLLSCGTDYLSVKYAFENTAIKSVAQPYLNGKIKQKNYLSVLKFRTETYKKLHYFIKQNTIGIIASDMDYHIPLINQSKYLGLIPNPINIDKFKVLPLNFANEIIIFHGINSESYFKKGNDFFEKALKIIEEKYYPKVEVIITRDVPYKKYIDLYNKAHIVLDQVYAHDQGYNALEAMAKGKVVFTGAETEFVNHYKLSERVAINAIPDVTYLVKELSFLIENPKEIKAISERARIFIEQEHDYIISAKKYIDIWNNALS